MNKNSVDTIVLHCTATKEGKDYSVEEIRRWHLKRGFSDIGYHYIVHLDGTIEKGRPDNQVGAHCNTSGLSGKPYNYHSIGVAYVGGLDKIGNPKDTRTKEQTASLMKLFGQLIDKFPNISAIKGHRDCLDDKNKDGKIDKSDWVKKCPCLDTQAEFPMSICIGKK